MSVAIIQNIDRQHAPLPVVYENAKVALSECYDLDECKSWSDKAKALASYAKQADDTELENMAKRIRGRAIRQMGVILKQFDARGGDRKSDDFKKDGSDHFDISKTKAAQQAGLSVRRQKQANRLSEIDEVDFEAKMESPNPPTITELEELGTKKRNNPHPNHKDALHISYDVKDLAERISKAPKPQELVEAFNWTDKERIKNNWHIVRNYLDKVFDIIK